MVANDTIVGLVGAGILVVALVGVFFYEAQNVPDMSQLAPTSYTVEGTGQSNFVPAGTPPAGLPCNPPVTTCPPARFYLNLTVTGLPLVNPLDLYWAVFLKEGGQMGFLGNLDAQGSLKHQSASDHPSAEAVVVSLERTNPPSAATLHVLTIPYTKGTLSAKANVSFAPKDVEQSLTITASGQRIDIQGTLKDLEGRPGMEYRVWLLSKEATPKYYYAGNISTPASGTFTGKVSISFRDGPSEGFSQVVIDLENTASKKMTLAGPVVYSFNL
jgi:hypothetical protein